MSLVLSILESFRTNPETLRMARVGDLVDGLIVRRDIPNRSSIEASMYDWEDLGVRVVPVSVFDDTSPPRNPDKRTRDLADAIKESGEINPLIVVYEQWNLDAGPYVLEGSHRIDALTLLGKIEFPALVILDTSE